jgi:RNA polymerase sigma-B factor
VGYVGLVKAADRFDPSFGVEYKTYAGVTVRGEIRRYFRDTTWSVRVPRRLQELRYEMRAATDVLRGRLRRAPTTAELADYLHIEVDELIDCMCADSNVRVLSIDHEDRNEGTPASEPGFADVDSMDAFQAMAELLPPRLRRIVEMRFVDQMTQSEIAAEFGVSQVQVSRLIRRALARLRPQLERGAPCPDVA